MGEMQHDNVSTLFSESNKRNCRFHGNYRPNSTHSSFPSRKNDQANEYCRLGNTAYQHLKARDRKSKYCRWDELTSSATNCDNWRLSCSIRRWCQRRTSVLSRITFGRDSTFDWRSPFGSGHCQLNLTRQSTLTIESELNFENLMN